ncbi:hypothetical protein, partial [Streptomyces sp. P17]|uniref:hypothetical protein n=1 Tax=Streptomyces sp. P17 TaxID=3074716 RepID=UPI0028F3EE2B
MSRTDQTRIDHANEARRAVSQTLGYAETDENTGALVGIAAVEAVLDLHAPEALEVLASNCATEECDHWDECPTETF